MTEKEMIDEVYDWFLNESEEAKTLFANTQKDQLISYHTTLGRTIRNHFKLWEIEWEPEYKMHGNVEYDDSPNHPDAISMRIIEGVWNKVREEYNA